MVWAMSTNRRPSWLRVTGVSIAIFLSVLALLWFRVGAGEDPVLGASASSAQVTSTATSGSSTDSNDTTTSSSSDGGTGSSSVSSSMPTTHAS